LNPVQPLAVEEANGKTDPLDGPRMSATGTEQPGLQSSKVVLAASAPAAVSVKRKSKGPVRSTFREYGLPLLLLGLSVVTTTANGARFMQNFVEGMPPVVRDSDLWPWGWLLEHPEMFKTGLAFSSSLLGILLIHEFGHYIACRWHRIRATLPWVLPAPTLSGTAGAIIKIRNRIPNRDALMDVGIYGPLAGYIASAIAVAVGFALSFHSSADAPTAIIRFGGEPLSIRLIHALLVHWDPSIPDFEHIAPHPVLVAGWIGLFITSLNLSPKAHKIFTNFLPILLFIMGTLYWVGWLLWGLFLMIPAMRHPKVPIAPELSRGRLALAVIGLVIFLLTFTRTPFYDNSLMHFFHPDPFRSTP
jgi:hypothetical protein